MDFLALLGFISSHYDMNIFAVPLRLNKTSVWHLGSSDGPFASVIFSKIND